MSASGSVTGRSVTPEPGGLVVITGASKGIGRAVADRFVADGADVVCVARAFPKPTSRDGTFHAKDGRRLLAADLESRSGIERTAETISAICESEDLHMAILHNNAGRVGELRDLGPDSLSAVEDLLTLHMGAPLVLTLSLLDHFDAGVRILNMTSRAAQLPLRGMAPYCISKAAQDALTRNLRLQLAGRGLHVGWLIPGEVDTDTQADLRAPDPQLFGLAEFFRQNRRNLIPPDLAACFIHWVLTGTTGARFEREEGWSIYDQADHGAWLPAGCRFDYEPPPG